MNLKKLFTPLFVFAFALSAVAQTTNLPGNPFAITTQTPLQAVNAAHAAAQANTNLSVAFAPPVGTNGWKYNSEIAQTNTWLAHAGVAFGIAMTPIAAPISNTRLRARVTIQPLGLPGVGDTLLVGFWTNTLGTLPADNSMFVGYDMTQTTQSWNFHHLNSVVGPSGPAWAATPKFTNGVYDLCMMLDGSNYTCTVVYPGHTNETWISAPLSQFSSSLLMSNVGPMWFGTNGLVNFISVRTNSEMPNPKNGGENVSDFVVYSLGGAGGANGGVTVRVSVPASYDAITNKCTLAMWLHGNTGNARNVAYDSVAISNNVSVTNLLRDYNNWLNSNNIIVCSVDYGNFDATGRKDTWGLSNSLYCLDAGYRYVTNHWAINPLGIILMGESAGGISIYNYAQSQALRGTNSVKIIGMLFNHAALWPSNTYADGVNISDINFAYGGSTIAQLAATTNANGYLSGDLRGLPIRFVQNIPIHVQASFGDTVVNVKRHTDLLGTAFGATPPVSNAVTSLVIYTNLPYTPEFSYYEVNGVGGAHGDMCLDWDCATNAVNFINRCITYASNRWVTVPEIKPYSLNISTTNAPGIPTNFH